MGASQSQPFMEELAGYKIIHKVPENNITHMSHIETDKQYLLKQLTYNDEKLFRKSLQEHKCRQAISDDHLIHLGRVEGKQIDHLCSNLYKIYAIWEYPYRFLADEINERSYQNRKFQDKQISSILASSIFALSTLQKNKIKHQMLTTRTILLDSEGLVKIADPLSCASSTNFDTIHRNRHVDDVYISPEQCEALELRGAYSNPYKSDVWVLGLIILECGLLENMSRCYKDEYQRIDFELINNKVAHFGRQYGEELKLVLQQMLKQDNKDRPDWIDLAQYTRKFKSPFIQPTFKQGTDHQEPSYTSNGKNNFSPNSNRNDNSSSFYSYQPTTSQQNPTPQVLRPSYDQLKQNYTQPRFDNQNTYTSTRPIMQDQFHPPPTNGPRVASAQWPYANNTLFIPPINRNYNNSNLTYPPSKQFFPNPANTSSGHQTQVGSLPYPHTLLPSTQFRTPALYSTKEGNLFPFPHSSLGLSNKPSEPWKNQDQAFSYNKVEAGKIDYYQKFKKDSQQFHMKPSELAKSDKQSQNYKFDPLTELRKNQVKANNLNFKPQQSPPTYTSFSLSTTNPTYGVSTFTNPSYSLGNESLFTPASFLQTISSFNTNKFETHQGSRPLKDQRELEAESAVPHRKGLAENQEVIAQCRGDQKPKCEDRLKDNSHMNLGAIIHNNESLEQHINTVQSNNQNTYVDMIGRDHSKTEGGVNDEECVEERPQFVVETFKQGSKYEGYKLKDMRHGQGKFYYQDGGMYDGEWKRNKMDGFGSLYYQSGELAYQGMWKDDQFQGKGKLYNEYPYLLEGPFDFHNFDQIDQYWSYYEGDFVQDFKKGSGILMLSNGEYIEGQFNNDMLEGPGVFYCKDGKTVKGVWRQNHLVSK